MLRRIARIRCWVRRPRVCASRGIARTETRMNNVLDAAGPQAAHIVDLWWLMLWVCIAVFSVVMTGLMWAIWRSPRSDAGTLPDTAPAVDGERRLWWSVGVGVAVSSL